MINDQNNQHQMTNIFEGNSLEIRAAAEQQLPSIQELTERGEKSWSNFHRLHGQS